MYALICIMRLNWLWIQALHPTATIIRYWYLLSSNPLWVQQHPASLIIPCYLVHFGSDPYKAPTESQSIGRLHWLSCASTKGAWDSLFAHPTFETFALPKSSRRTTQKAHAWYISIPCMGSRKIHLIIYVSIRQPTARYTIYLPWTSTVVLSFDDFRDLRSFEGQRQALINAPSIKVAPTHMSPLRAFCKYSAMQI